ncbi:two-component response regulator ORR23-like [Silene latifolia]|uniref:two-component response regulator ORR23-like n=1 Tax=Silene latifolia TaxID=37657 RepID=UPI003D77AE27
MLPQVAFEKSVTTTSEASIALNMVKEDQNKFDIVICNVHMPDMDDSKLFELAELKPLIMMSTKLDMNLLKRGFAHGACEYMRKPVRLEELQNIWQHVIKREVFNKNSAKGKGQKRNVSVNNDEPSATKKSRLVWTTELHQKFLEAVNELGGLKKANPTKIQKQMNIEGLTRENVASHLRMYWKYMKRAENSSLASKEANIVTASSGQNSENNFQNADPSAQNKPPVYYWSVELHLKFLQVINQHGLEFLDKADHEEILKLMNVPKLDRENFNYHLQKYRHFIKTRGCDQKELLANMILGYQLVKEFNVPSANVFFPHS